MAEEKIYYTTVITDMDLNGRGIGRNEGKAVFIPGCVTGDVVRYTTEKSEKRFDVGQLCELVTPSPHRVSPPCNGSDICGGCVFGSVERSLELKIKLSGVESAFRRAGLSHVKVTRIISGSPSGYRNKAVFHHENGKYGFKTKGDSSIYSGSCLLLPNIFNDIIRYIEELVINTSDVPPNSIMLRIGSASVMICAEVNKHNECNSLLRAVCEKFPSVTSVYECIGYPTSRDTRYFHLWGDSRITVDFAGARLGISAPSFFQVNEEVAAALVSEICRFASPDNGETILDLYCGIGSITLPVAKRFPDTAVLGIEINPSAVEDAKRNAADSGICNAEFVCSDAGRYDFGGSAPDVVIVDPPRFGLTDGMISSILKMRPKKLIYMSCNPSTLAGNSLKLIRGGYNITYCVAADMFPGAGHVECVACFTRPCK